jgi:hypothetical protein
MGRMKERQVKAKGGEDTEQGFKSLQRPSIEEALAEAKEEKLKQKRPRMICTCGDPTCGVGPFTLPYHGD